MSHQNDSAALINRRLNCRNIQIRVARAGYGNGLRRYGSGKGDRAHHPNQSSFNTGHGSVSLPFRLRALVWLAASLVADLAARPCGPPSLELLAFAAHLVIPVHERAVGVVPPCPDVQFEMCRQAVPVRAVDELERLSLEHRRSVVTRQPGRRRLQRTPRRRVADRLPTASYIITSGREASSSPSPTRAPFT